MRVLIQQLGRLQQSFGLVVVLEQRRIRRMMFDPLDETIERHALHRLVRVGRGERAQRDQIVRFELETSTQGAYCLRVLFVLHLSGAQILPREHVLRLGLHRSLEQEHRVDNVVRAQTLDAFVECARMCAQRILGVELVGLVRVEHFLELVEPRVIRVFTLFNNQLIQLSNFI